MDIFTVICIKAISTVGLIPAAKRWGLVFLIVPVAIVYVFVVALIPGIEFIKSKMQPDFPAMDAIERRAVADAGPAQPAPQAGVTAAARRSNADKARALAAASPNLTATQLAALAGVSWKTASNILKKVTPVSGPVSPGAVPTSELNADMAA